MTQNIDEQIRTYYAGQSLSPEALGRMRQLIDKPAATRSSTLRAWQTIAMAATVAMAFLAGVLFVARTPVTTPATTSTTVATTDLSNRIAEEVAMRHQTCKHVDFTATELASLGPEMKNLDFRITEPEGIDLSKMKLQGAHYCVINGQLALHATYIDPDGHAVSLMETRMSSQLASMKHATHEVDQVEVEMWQKNDVIIAMARPVTT